MEVTKIRPKNSNLMSAPGHPHRQFLIGFDKSRAGVGEEHDAMTSFRITRIDCVILTAFDSAFSFLKNSWVFDRIRAHHANSVEQADFLLVATGATVLLTDISIVACSWHREW